MMLRTANYIKDLRKKKKMTLRELARRAGISYGYLSDIENMKANPTLRELELIAHVLGVGLYDVVNKHEHKPGLHRYGDGDDKHTH